MLVLSRKINESIMVGHSIEIKIIDIKGDNVKLGICAPKDIPVHRQEIYENIVRHNQTASQIAPETLKRFERAIKKPSQKG